MIRTIVVDDEPIARAGMTTLVNATDGFQVIGSFGTGASAVQSILELAPDLVLLDVQMPDLTGLDVVRRVGPDRMPPVVFVTAFDQFAVDAFELNALDYVLKPFTDDRLRTALRRASDATRASQFEALADRYVALLEEYGAGLSLAGAPVTHHTAERLVVQGTGSTKYVPVDDIAWIEAESQYARIHIANQSFLMRESLQSLARRLDHRFLRVHRSAILRVDLVRELRRDAHGDVSAKLLDGTPVPVSKARVAELESRLAT